MAASARKTAETPENDRIDPTRAEAAYSRWRRALAEAIGHDPGAGLDRPEARLLMLRVFGSTRRLADLCMKHPAAVCEALLDGAPGVLAQAARDIEGFSSGSGGPDALYGALAPVKGRCDAALAVAELSGAFSADEAAAARTDLAERIVEAALQWLVKGAANRGELPLAGLRLDGIFVLAGEDFAHEDIAPHGPLDLVVFYDEKLFPGAQGRMAERAFIRIGSDLVEAFHGRSGDYPLFLLRTPFGTGLGGQGVAESFARAKGAIADPQRGDLRRWMASARVVAGDRRAAGAFQESVEEAVWNGQGAAPGVAAQDDPRTPYRELAALFRRQYGALRPVFRSASIRQALAAAANWGGLPRDVADRLIAGQDFAQALVSRAQMMKGATALGASAPDEEAALARLCGFTSHGAFAAVRDGFLADSREALARAASGPQAEFSLYWPAGERPDDADKLEDLGFDNGAELAATVDSWAALAAKEARFAALAPGVLTAFGETQRPNEAARLFDAIARAHDNPSEIFSRLASSDRLRGGLADALGSFGAAVAPLAETPELAVEFFERRGPETPRDGAEWLSRFPPPSRSGSIEHVARWRRECIARVALYAAAGDMSFSGAASALAAIAETAAVRAFETLARTDKAASGIALHLFDSVAMGLPGTSVKLGLIASECDGDATEAFARRYLQALEKFGDDYFGLDPDLSHRPGGVAGPLCPSLAAFKSFIQCEAIAHDQMLLARARVVAGAPKAREAAESALRSAVSQPRRADALLRDLDRARAQRLRRDRSAAFWDFERLEGGPADVDLIVSTLIYRHAGAHPELQRVCVEAALDAMKRSGIAPPCVIDALKNARRFWVGLSAARALARFNDPARENIRPRLAALFARAAEVESFAAVRPLMQGHAEEIGRLYAQLVLGRPTLALAG